MTLQQLKEQLEELYPTAYSHFKASADGSTVPEPPYICYYETGGNGDGADDYICIKSTSVRIELYMVKKDLNAEKAVEEMLKRNNLPWEKDCSYLSTEDIFMNAYDIEFYVN